MLKEKKLFDLCRSLKIMNQLRTKKGVELFINTLKLNEGYDVLTQKRKITIFVYYDCSDKIYGWSVKAYPDCVDMGFKSGYSTIDSARKDLIRVLWIWTKNNII